jgi:hypothetical protein
MNDKINPKEFLGQAYTPQIGRHLPYGAIINSKGIIVQVMTEEDYADL